MNPKGKHDNWINNGFNRLFDSSVPIQRRIMSIIAYSAVVANAIGFLANYLLYGMSVPTAFCLICDVFLVVYLLFGLKSKSYLFYGFLLCAVLIAFEFPLLLFAYGPVMLPYMVLGFMTIVMLTSGKTRFVVGAILLAFDLAVIVLSQLYPFVFGEQESGGLIGSAVITFSVALIALTFCMITWQNVYLRNVEETDGVTGILSRSGFFRKAENLIHNAASKRYSVLVFDIRNFRSFNTEYGTEEGNELLRSFANSIQNAYFHPILLGRLQGDRFVCLVDSTKISEKTLQSFCHYSYLAKGKNVQVTVSCGIFVIDDATEDIHVICDKAASVIRFIRVGQNKFVDTFDETMEESFLEETRVLKDVENAIRCRHFEPYYQPIVDARTGQIVCAEALARWSHPEKGIIYPDIFIPILEKKEMISQLDSIMVDKVNRFIQNRSQSGLPCVPISANLSRVDLFNETLLEEIQSITEMDKGRSLRFEITESALISLPSSVMHTLSKWQNNGIRIMMDDFGSGYSSLGLISNFDFDVIKLDRQFAAHIEDSAKSRGVIKCVVELAHNMNAKVIAEGVETKQQAAFLQECGCDYIQGYYYYRPMNEGDFSTILNDMRKS